MSTNNFVGVWFDGTKWRVESSLNASISYTSRAALEGAFARAHLCDTRAHALVYAHDLANGGDYEYGVIELHEDPPHTVTLRRCQWCGAIAVEEIRYGSIRVTKDGGGDECPECGKELEPTAKNVAVGDAYVIEQEPWEDKADEWSESIKAAHPAHNDRTHEQYAIAMKMVGNRHSKQALVALVTWLLWSRIPDPSL